MNLRSAEHVDGARQGFVLKQLDVRDGFRHLEGVALLHALLVLLRHLKHHH